MPIDLLDFDRQGQKRRAFFERRGYDAPPSVQAERYQLALSLCDRDAPDWEAAHALYDPLEDCKHTPFLYLLSRIYATPGTRLHDPVQAAAFARKAYLYAGAIQQDEAAQNYLSLSRSAHKRSLATLLREHDDPVLTDALTMLIGKDIKPDVFHHDGNASLADFAAAIFRGNGQTMPRDDFKATRAYEHYIQEQSKGFLALAYQNLALRYALGIGSSPRPHVALTILETAEFLLEDGRDTFKDLRDVLKRYAKKLEQQRYQFAASNMRDRFLTSDSAWAMFDVINESSRADREVVTDTVNLLSMLAHAENWSHSEDWDSMSDFAKEKFSYTGLWADVRSVSALYEVNAFHATIDQEPSRLSLPPFRAGLYKYFAEHKLGIPPYSSADRFRKSLEFRDAIPPQYNHAYALFDERSDTNDKDWLSHAGYILDAHLDNDALFDPKKAEIFMRRAAELGSAVAAFNLGVKYRNGNDGAIDLDEAIKWYRRADELGDAHAKNRIANTLKLKMEVENPDNAHPITNEIIQLYWDAYRQGDLNAGQDYARILINGAAGSKNIPFALEMYEWITAQQPQYVSQIAHANVAHIMAIRSYLGLDVQKDNTKALEYLDKIPDQSNHSHIRYYMQELKQQLKKYIIAEHGPGNQDLALIKRLYESPEEIQSTIDGMDKTSKRVSATLASYAVCVHLLANAEEWPSRYDWSDLDEAVQANQLGFTFQQAVQSTRDSGPRYTALDNRGLPVLGVFLKPSKDETEENKARAKTGSYVPQPGLLHLNEIRADKNGIRYVGAYSEDLPAMLTIEDQTIAELLVFGDSDKGPVYPSLSLETQNNDKYGKDSTGNDYDRAFTYKIYTPQWLAYTDFGRTLWITDYLIGQWCWNPEKFKTGSLYETASPALHGLAKDFIRDLRLTGGRDGGASSARVMIQPKSAYITPQAPANPQRRDAATVSIKQMRMKVYGSYILNDGQTENRSLFEEDPNFAQGRTVKKLTDRYNDIMKLDPRFERAQQLMGLFYGLLRLWELGYRPPADIQQELTHRMKAMESLGRDKDKNLLVRRAFGLRPY